MNNIIKKKNKFGKTKFFFNKLESLPSSPEDKFSSLSLFNHLIIDKNCGGARYENLFKNSMNEFPLVSIIMPNFKENNLSRSIDSILNQEYQNIELIIIDGESGNETNEILKKYGDDVDIWISEKDNNLWDAWNKGFLLARGDYVGIVDSSNILYPDSINILKKYFKENSEIDFLCGTIKKDNKVYMGYRPNDIYKQFNIIPSTVVGFYIKLTSLKKVGLLNIQYKFQSDYDWLYRIIVTQKMKGKSTKAEEIFGDLGKSNFSTKFSFFSTIINELKIRFYNKQSIIILLYIFFGRTLMKLYNILSKSTKLKK